MCDHKNAELTLTPAVAMIGATKVQCAWAAVKASPVALLVRPPEGRIHDLICSPKANLPLPAKSGKGHRILHAVTCLAGIALWPFSVHADTMIWGDLNTTPPYYNGTVTDAYPIVAKDATKINNPKTYGQRTYDIAVPFTTTGNNKTVFNISKIDIAVGDLAAPDAFRLIISTDLAPPGSKDILFSRRFTSKYTDKTSPNANTLDTIPINKPASLQLKGDTQYYIEIFPLSNTSQTSGFWNENNVGETSKVWTSNDNGKEWTSNPNINYQTPAFDIWSNTQNVANPGPTMGAGLTSFPIAYAAYWLIKRRRQKTNPMFFSSLPVIG